MNERRTLLRQTAELAADYLEGLPGRHVGATATRAELLAAMGGPLPEGGEAAGEIVEHLARAVQRKLVQKVPAADGSPGLITNLYLSEDEYARLAELPAASLRKTRHSIPPFGVDVFEGELEGLILAEIEFATAEDEAAFEPSIPIVAEVTRDVRFTGGRLVESSAAELRELLREFGL